MRTITLENGEQYTVSDRGVMTYVEPEENTSYTEEERRVISNIYTGDTSYSNHSHVLAYAGGSGNGGGENVAGGGGGGGSGRYPMFTTTSNVAIAQTARDSRIFVNNQFTSDSIENFNWNLYQDIWMGTSFVGITSPAAKFLTVYQEYSRYVRHRPHMRVMGNTQRVFVNGETISILESNRTIRRRATNSTQRRVSSYETRLYGSFAELYGNAVTSGEAVQLSPYDGNVSLTWHPPIEGARMTPDNSPRQLRPKVCRHKSCIRCKGTFVYGKDDTPCLHMFECHCIFCKP